VTVTTSGTVADRVSRATLEKASARDDEIVQTAVQYVGLVPYVHDGADPKTGFDCSGLVLYVFARFGISVPHDVDGIAALGKPVAADRLQPGDLVVYAHQHIGIYLGDGYMVDAPNVGRDVEVQQVWGSPTYVRLPAS
jgi:cell wall-associated NlpC family hydrolase